MHGRGNDGGDGADGADGAVGKGDGEEWRVTERGEEGAREQS